MEITVCSLDEMNEFAKEIKSKVLEHKKVILEGEMGAGKTTFTAFLCKHLEIEDEVSSPTYALVNEYKGKTNVNHIDAYRISDAEEAIDAGLEEYLTNDEICVIEWASRIEEILPESYLTIKIELLSDKCRKIVVF